MHAVLIRHVVAGLLVASIVTAAVAQTEKTAQTGKATPQSTPRRVPPHAENNTWTPVEPVRRAPAAAPLSLPALPPRAEQIEPLTVDVDVVHESASGESRRLRQIVTRTVDKVHIATDRQIEWLFERNPVDPRRVSGFRIDHDARAVVFYSDTDLRTMMGVLGWAHVLTLGLDHTRLGPPLSAAEVRVISGIRFTRTSVTGETGPARDAWWSAQHVLPAAFAAPGPTGVARTTVTRAEAGVDARRLDPPSVRFPQYRQTDLAEWLEHP